MSLPDDLITPKAAAKLVAVSTSTVYRWVEEGKLRAYRVAGTRYRLSRADVLAMVQEVEVGEPVRTAGEDERAAAAALGRMRADGRKV